MTRDARRLAAPGAAALLLLAACTPTPAPVAPTPPAIPLPAIRFTIQAGAFADAENAIRLARSLDAAGVEAFHFEGDDGMSRVRFGSFPTRDAAARRAEALRAEGVLAEYAVVAVATAAAASRPGLRGDVVRSALSFVGQPYRWGAADGAFDCSGLTMTAYRLNGLGLPRSSAEQFALGLEVGGQRLREADLVFFAIETEGRPSHVGLYVGEGRFVHAPGAGKLVRLDELSSPYYRRRFLSARSYLD